MSASPDTTAGATEGAAAGAVTAVTADAVRQRLEHALALTHLEVVDDSHRHAGHAGAREGRHFTVRLTGPCFDGLSRLARHRLVYHALEPLMNRGIHALAIHAKASGE